MGVDNRPVHGPATFWPSPFKTWGGVWGKAPRNQIHVYTKNLQLTNVFLCRFVAESILHLHSTPYSPPKKKLRICANPKTK